jgi:hypothetical protein
MKKRKALIPVLLLLVITTGCFVVFYSRIACKPDQAGFWFVFVLGVSLGVALTRGILWFREKNGD